MPIRSRISSIMGQHPDLFVLKFEKKKKKAEYDFVYTQASTNVNQLLPNMVTMYMTMRSWMSSIMGRIRREHLKLFALE